MEEGKSQIEVTVRRSPLLNVLKKLAKENVDPYYINLSKASELSNIADKNYSRNIAKS